MLLGMSGRPSAAVPELLVVTTHLTASQTSLLVPQGKRAGPSSSGSGCATHCCLNLAHCFGLLCQVGAVSQFEQGQEAPPPAAAWAGSLFSVEAASWSCLDSKRINICVAFNIRCNKALPYWRRVVVQGAAQLLAASLLL